MAVPRPPLVLASTSRYRKALLERLRLPFSVADPGVDEAPQPGEAPAALALRLAGAKALAVASRMPGAVVIGSDQVATLDGAALGKPGTPERAMRQLAAASGRCVEFLTAVAVAVEGQLVAKHLDLTRVRFRALSALEIERYVALDTPLDCAGSFRAESLGVALFDAIESRDPTALVGLPLVWLASSLRATGLDPLG
jgi:septum formation protein